MTIVPFLRGDGVTLGPVPKGAPLPPLALRSLEAAHGAAIEMAAWRGDVLVGMISLGPLDWLRRTAGLTARGDVDEAALRLAVRYAFEELNLERVDTDPVRGEIAATLRSSGAEPAGDRWSWLKVAP